MATGVAVVELNRIVGALVDTTAETVAVIAMDPRITVGSLAAMTTLADAVSVIEPKTTAPTSVDTTQLVALGAATTDPRTTVGLDMPVTT